MKGFWIAILAGVVALGLSGVWTSCSMGSPEAGSPTVPSADLETATFRVDGMTCGGCEAGVKTALKKLDGVHEVEASYTKGNTRVTYEPAKIEPEKIKAAIEQLGYQARLEAGS